GPAGCMVEFDDDLVINIDGAIYKCPAFVGREGFSMGDLRRGVVETGTAYNPDVWKKPECLACAYLPQCYGGCRFLKYVRDGRVDDVDCWRPFLDATLEKCIRQDLAYRKGTAQSRR
ncbi:MAG TPA: SPASM domain-containing protein, partial [Geobacteraceae bacterium]